MKVLAYVHTYERETLCWLVLVRPIGWVKLAPGISKPLSLENTAMVWAQPLSGERLTLITSKSGAKNESSNTSAYSFLAHLTQKPISNGFIYIIKTGNTIFSVVKPKGPLFSIKDRGQSRLLFLIGKRLWGLGVLTVWDSPSCLLVMML